MPRKPNEAGNARVKGFKADGTKDKRCAKRGEAGYHERSVDAAHEAYAKKQAELAAQGRGNEYCTFPDAAEFRAVADKYFETCDQNDEVYSIAGLCLWLSDHNEKGRIVTRAKLQRWWNGDEAAHLQEVVQYELLKIQREREAGKLFLEPKMAGARNFDLKQPMLGGFTDKTEVKQDVRFELTIKDYDEELTK